jgi:hypothetical protein
MIPGDLLGLLHAWKQIRRRRRIMMTNMDDPKQPGPNRDATDPADLPDFDDDPCIAPDELEEPFDPGKQGESWMTAVLRGYAKQQLKFLRERE